MRFLAAKATALSSLRFLLLATPSAIMQSASAFAMVATTRSSRPSIRRRSLASLAATLATDSPSLLDPSSEPLVYPKSLSPSSIAAFQACPQSFLFQYMLGLSQPTTLALLKGRLTHSTLEQLFDLPAQHRTLENAQNLLRKCYSGSMRNDNLDLFQTENISEIQWGRECLQLLENYMQVEDPITLPQPAQREVWVRAVLKHDDDNASSGDDDKNAVAGSSTSDGILVRGIVDRLDLVRTYTTSSSSAASFRITDYKTGKAPNLKYSAACNQRIRDEAFFQLQIYALLLQEMRLSKAQRQLADRKDSGENGMECLPVTQLRLFYLTSGSGDAKVWDDAVADLADTKQRVLDVWKQIRELVDTQDPRAFAGCSRSFCYCHKCRNMFVPGSVWEPPSR